MSLSRHQSIMSFQSTPVFVIDVTELAAFAFEADDFDAARYIVGSHWLLQPLDAFCRARRPADRGQLRLRTATDHEATLYRDRADEFAEAERRFLVVHLV
jgi:hypothetical protein